MKPSLIKLKGYWAVETKTFKSQIHFQQLLRSFLISTTQRDSNQRPTTRRSFPRTTHYTFFPGFSFFHKIFKDAWAWWDSIVLDTTDYSLKWMIVLPFRLFNSTNNSLKKRKTLKNNFHYEFISSLPMEVSLLCIKHFAEREIGFILKDFPWRHSNVFDGNDNQISMHVNAIKSTNETRN